MSFTIDRIWRAAARVAVVLVFASIASGAHAQQNGKMKAVKASCRSDYIANCMSVTPGGKEALQCLQRNVAKLSPACKTAVSATMAPPPAAAKPKPAAAAAPPPKAAPRQLTAAQKDAMRASCRGDYMSHCSGVSPGGSEALACLRRNVGQLSAACRQAVGATPASKRAVRAAPPPDAPPAVAGPTPKQMKALKFTCRRDFRAYCRGVPPGGQAAFACLVRNTPRLTQNCRTSVRAILETAPPAPQTAAPVAPPPAAQPPSRATVIDAAVMLRACKRDMFRHCRGVDPGGGRVLNCLVAHKASLGFRCKAALKVTSPLR